MRLPERDLDCIPRDVDVDDTEAVRAARQWRRQLGPEGRPWLLLFGPPGVGKSFAAARSVALSTSDRSMVVRPAELVRLCCVGFGERPRDLEWPFVVLVDLGTEHGEARFLPALSELFEHPGKRRIPRWQ